MGSACSTYRGEEKCIWDFGVNVRREKDDLEDIDVGGRIILKWILEQ
jgi:hypothetical protein